MRTFGKPKTAGDRLIVALDTPDYGRATALVSQLCDRVGGFKIGSVLTTAIGVPAAVALVRSAGVPVMLDEKWHDIPKTMAAAAIAADMHCVDLLTVHGQAGIEAMGDVMEAVRGARVKRAQEEGCALMETRREPLVAAVTVLTSISDFQSQVSRQASFDDLVHNFAHDAAVAQLDGIVCSPLELERMRSWQKTRNKLLIAVGIRPDGAPANGQARFGTPLEAIRNGADYLVVGDPIINASGGMRGVVDATCRILEEIEVCLPER